MEYSKKIGKNIKKTRHKMNMSQKKFGEKLGITGSFVGYLENGNKRVNPDLLKKISKLTKQPVSYFYDEKPQFDKTMEVFSILLEEKNTKKRTNK